MRGRISGRLGKTAETPGPAPDHFASYPLRYDRWYDRHPRLFRAELAALKLAGGDFSGGLEVGAGTGRFASALGLSWGIDPSGEMLALARGRGCRVLRAAGEDLPFAGGAFRRVLMMTVLCFLADPARAVSEALRVLRPGGCLVIGMIERESALGRAARARRDGESFYAGARFLSAGEVLDLLPEEVRERAEVFPVTLPAEPKTGESPAAGEGHGRDGFLVISAPVPSGSR